MTVVVFYSFIFWFSCSCWFWARMLICGIQAVISLKLFQRTNTHNILLSFFQSKERWWFCNSVYDKTNHSPAVLDAWFCHKNLKYRLIKGELFCFCFARQSRWSLFHEIKINNGYHKIVHLYVWEIWENSTNATPKKIYCHLVFRAT